LNLWAVTVSKQREGGKTINQRLAPCTLFYDG